MSLAVPVDVARLPSDSEHSPNDDAKEAARKVFARDDHDGPLAIRTWVGAVGPWLVLVAGIALVIVGEILYSP